MRRLFIIAFALIAFTAASAPAQEAAPEQPVVATETAPVPETAPEAAPAPETEAKPGDKVIDMLPAKVKRWALIVIAILAACFPLATVITTFTKTPSDDKWVGRIRKYFEKWFSFAKRNPGGGVTVSRPGEDSE